MMAAVSGMVTDDRRSERCPRAGGLTIVNLTCIDHTERQFMVIGFMQQPWLASSIRPWTICNLLCCINHRHHNTTKTHDAGLTSPLAVPSNLAPSPRTRRYSAR